MDLSNMEIIEYVIGYLGNDMPRKMILFLNSDCNINIQSEFSKFDNYEAIYNIICNDESIGLYRFAQNSEAILVELFDKFTEDDKRKIKKKIIEIRERNKKNNSDINSKSNNESINIYNNPINNNTANASINQNITIKSTIEDINKIPENILDKETKEYLEEILYSIETLKEKNKDKAKEKVFKVLKYIIDKGFEVGIAILPYLGEVSKVLR
ncbi:hypothetical protein [Brachyspira aalborgi]|jgi:hypothetical protein|uniref:Uncharacterized protein n=1 Tax=Brachyspira aalborgi TaxID=29522 RepID=A0ABY3K8X5_9SPIR|nr:hypothetical protein [Brachyspira aalborgi]MBS4763300.1 hypothetical protein [Brachyspira sp.]TXJ32373.1 hypothetical protein EPJ71_09815 [Brachyspira aalborgi]TXJ40232.1 hypothetical protein EPJ65_11545 [Brachyspira aalborgi]CCY76454.1 putative uncharacterized protein [Brachyspira sp. CAG:700]